MTRWKKKYTSKIRNVSLVTPDDLAFKAFIENIKLEAYRFRKSNQRKYSDIISIPLEMTVRHWIKETGLALDERIISYEKLNIDNKYQQHFNELDFIYEFYGKYWLGEVKVSSSPNAKYKASNQLENSQSILKTAQFETELLLIHIDLTSEDEMDKIEFNCDFQRMKLNISESSVPPSYYLKLNGNSIFKYGVDVGIIKDQSLLLKAAAEAKGFRERRNERRSLIEKNIPVEDWPGHLIEDQTIEDQEQHLKSFGKSQKESSFAQKLKDALNKNNNEDTV